MTNTTQKRAYRLWKRYKTSTMEYRELAASMGLTTADLNAVCWGINHAKTIKQRAKR